MILLKEGKTNWKYVLVVLVLALIVGGVTLWCSQKQEIGLPSIISPKTEKPFIRLLSPNGGEEWIEGNTYEITWESSKVEKVNIEAVTGGKDLGHIVFGVDAELRKYSWKIPNGFITGFGIPKSDEMKIRIYDATNPDIFDENDNNFTIKKEDETANWKTYRNEKYGYQIKYPKDWIIQKNILGAFDIYKSFYDYNCSVEVYADTLEYLYPIEEAEGYFQPFSEFKISTKEEIAFIGNISGKKLLSPELAGREIYFLKEEVKNLLGQSQYYYFNIFLDVYKQDPHGEPIIKENKCKDVFKEILSTFQFTKEKTTVDQIPDATCVYRQGEYEMRFYDLQGRMTGIKNWEIKEEIPGSYYIPRDLNSPLDCPPNCYEIVIPDYVPIHKFEIFGIKEGNYKLVINAIVTVEEEPVTFSAINIPIISGLTHVYIFEWEILARGEEGVVIFVDLDGDGIFEKSITSDKMLNCEEFIIQLKKS